MKRIDIDKLLQETDWVMLGDVKDTVENIDEFTFYRHELREIRKLCTDDDTMFALPVKPDVIWKNGIEE